MRPTTPAPLQRLGDVCVLRRQSVEPADIMEGTYYLGLEHIASDGLATGVRVEAGEVASLKLRFRRGDILYGKLRPYLRKIAIAEEDGICSTEILALVPGPQVHCPYVFHFLRSPPVVEYATMRCGGANLPRVSPQVLLDIEVPLPPLPEQRRIATILDEADALRRKRHEALGLLDELLRAAFLEMFGDPVTNPRGWETVEMRAVIVDSQYGTAEKANTDGVGLPVLRMNNLGYDGSWDLSDLKHCDVADADLNKFTVRPGDLLFNRTNSPELVGKTGVWKLDQPFAFAGYLIRIRFDQARVLPEYVSGYLNSAAGKRYLLERAKPSNNMSNFNATMFGEIPLHVPPLDVQREFVDIVSAVGLERARFEVGTWASDALFQALLHRAFTGGL